MLSKKHFEAMAEHIARETKPGSKEREGAMKLAIATAKASNPRFDEGRFRGAVDGLTSGTHTVGDSGRIRKVSGTPEVKKLSSGNKELTYNSRGAKLLTAVAEKSMKRSGGGWTNNKPSSGGGAGDEPRDDHGRWTK